MFFTVCNGAYGPKSWNTSHNLQLISFLFVLFSPGTGIQQFKTKKWKKLCWLTGGFWELGNDANQTCYRWLPYLLSPLSTLFPFFCSCICFLERLFFSKDLWYSCSVLSFFLLSFIVSSILFLFFFCSFLWFLLILFLFFLTFYCFYSCFSSLLFYMLLLFPFSLALVLLSKCKMDKNGHLSVTYTRQIVYCW